MRAPRVLTYALRLFSVVIVLLLSCRVLGSRRIVGSRVTVAFRTLSACFKEGRCFLRRRDVLSMCIVRTLMIASSVFDDWLTAFAASHDAYDAA
jgi:hypothetical protein